MNANRGVGAVLIILLSSAIAHADPLIPLRPNPKPLIPYSYSPYANGTRTTTSLTFVRAPVSISAQTTVSAPDGGTILLGGYNSAREGRSEFGAPGLGRPFRNSSYARSLSGSTISVRVRVINLREMDEQILGRPTR
jgi:hypothetical protein